MIGGLVDKLCTMAALVSMASIYGSSPGSMTKVSLVIRSFDMPNRVSWWTDRGTPGMEGAFNPSLSPSVSELEPRSMMLVDMVG